MIATMKSLLLLLLASGPALADDASVLQCRNLKDAAPRLACYDNIVVPAARPVQAAAPTPAGAAATATSVKAAEQSFGLPEKSVVDAIESSIPGKFEGWGPNQQFTLANGQVWRISDGSSAYIVANDVKVRIEKGMFKSMVMKIQGVNQSPSVRRVK
jgi:hypothetical protein